MGDLGSILGLGRSAGGEHGNPAPVFLPGESAWTEEPVGYSPWGCKESDTTERLSSQHKVTGVTDYTTAQVERAYWNTEM